MCEEPRHREYDFCKQLRAKLDAKAQQKQLEELQVPGVPPVADRLKAAQEQVLKEEVLVQRSKIAVQNAEISVASAQAEAAKGTSEDESMPLMDRIEHAQQEMCEEEQHKNYPFCVDLQ